MSRQSDIVFRRRSLKKIMDRYADRKIYRDTISARDLCFYRVSYLDTDLLVRSDENYHDIIETQIIKTRKILNEHIANNAKFLESLTPIGYNVKNDIIVKNMCEAAKKADVGPMATVAGVFSKVAFEAIAHLSDEVIVENGGDLLIKSDKKRTVALYAGDSKLSMKLAIKVGGDGKPIGICASAGTIGHSLSFGKADMAMVISPDILLADALATKLGNMIKAPCDLKHAIETVYRIDGVQSVIGIIGDDIAAVGDIEIVPI
jgi:uncharacterized protein